MRQLVSRWRDDFDWHAWESKLNNYPQYRTVIDGQPIHALHIRAPMPNALPLILTHGWPGSVLEYLDIIDVLGAEFDLVIPSLPGFGFSSAPVQPGWNRRTTARAWAELMRRLGYTRYGAVGNDLGANVSLELGRVDRDRIAGVHVTQIFSGPKGTPGELDDLSRDDRDRLRALAAFRARRGAYLGFQSSQPLTIAHALADSPAALLAWHGQLVDDSVHPDFAIATAALYWLTGTAASALHYYHQDAHISQPTEPTTVPVAVAEFADDVFRSVRAFAHRDHSNIVSWHEYEGGGHFAAHQSPHLLAHDIRTFFTAMRTSPADESGAQTAAR